MEGSTRRFAAALSWMRDSGAAVANRSVVAGGEQVVAELRAARAGELADWRRRAGHALRPAREQMRVGGEGERLPGSTAALSAHSPRSDPHSSYLSARRR